MNVKRVNLRHSAREVKACTGALLRQPARTTKKEKKEKKENKRWRHISYFPGALCARVNGFLFILEFIVLRFLKVSVLELLVKTNEKNKASDVYIL